MFEQLIKMNCFSSDDKARKEAAELLEELIYRTSVADLDSSNNLPYFPTLTEKLVFIPTYHVSIFFSLFLLHMLIFYNLIIVLVLMTLN